MTIKLRITLGFLCSIAVVAVCVIGYTGWQMREDARGYFVTSSNQQLQLMEQSIRSFVNGAIHNAQIIAEQPGLADAQDAFPRFVDNPQESRYLQAELGPEATALTEPLLRVGRANHDYLEIYVGFADGSYASSCDDMKIPPHHDLSTKDWYRQRASDTAVAGLAPAYFSVTGEMVVAVTHKLLNARGELAGVVGIDISLADLSQRVAALSFGETGFFLLLENSGRIICHPNDEELVGKIIGKDVQDPALQTLMNTSGGMVDVSLGGEAYEANVLTTDFGWKIVALESAAEINARSNTAMRHVTIIAVVIALLVLMVALFMVRSIVRPLNALVRNAQEVAGGNLEARVNNCRFFGELALLHDSIASMIEALGRLLGEAKRKTEEAERHTARAEEAMRHAEEARRAAENARREGMTEAAHHLEESTGVIHGAAGQLSDQIAQSSQGAQHQAERAAETATAMGQMNATVLEVARNAGNAAEVSENMRGKAEEGAGIVSEVVRSIQSLHDMSLTLKEDMSRLGENATAITRIMSVISDIADQTNLLALNAAIEAARAGEAGRGFAVVADEVRKLAEKTMASTSEVANAINAIQKSAEKSIRQVEISVEGVNAATELAGRSGEALKEIVSLAEHAADQVRAIAAASEEQSATSEEINRSISEINEIAGQNAAAMEQAAQAVNEMAAEAQKLNALIEKMKQG
ncbi:methyl-accepting chemotaxis protein [uncultured Desulfovibrio sp.]|uniref:HAMP domain-containing protein n=1 Tax=Candidatus Desulfovibrio intestinavium TaxID=2838534 RepID=A0A9D2KR83_9BACT|nr:methyl-accepting chemotaxis protein [uncultured Desulfovibrio sp.]HJA78106.1 HAMP domain-containing protein [Candidatus Desulfovibrio intestinavium]